MHIKKLFGVGGAEKAKGVAVIIDVLRAATVCAHLLAKGVKEIIPVSTKEEAFYLKKINPDYLLVGEIDGYKIPGFDFGNSPSAILKAKNLQSKTIVHRSTMGTQGIVNAKNAAQIIFGAFVTASAIAKYLLKQNPNDVSIVAMNITKSEDDMLADYLIAKITNNKPKSIQEIINEIKKHSHAKVYLDPNIPEFPKEDFYLSLQLDRFDFIPIMNNGKIVKYELNGIV